MIALGCDHGGFPLMKEVIAYLDANNIPYKNYGTFSEESVDYPVYGKLVAHAVADGECEKGILICGTGIGISIVPHDRYQTCHCAYSPRGYRHDRRSAAAYAHSKDRTYRSVS